VIRCAATVLGALDDQLQLLADPGLTDELAKRAGAQTRVDVALANGQRRRHLAVGGVLVVFLVEPAHRVLLPAQQGQRRPQCALRGCVRLSREHLVGGFLGLLGREPKAH
jgi:hypothetical protein